MGTRQKARRCRRLEYDCRYSFDVRQGLVLTRALRIQNATTYFWLVLEAARPNRIDAQIVQKGLCLDEACDFPSLWVTETQDGWMIGADPQDDATWTRLTHGVAVDAHDIEIIPILPIPWTDPETFQTQYKTQSQDILLGRSVLHTYVEGHVSPTWLLLDATASDDIPGYLTDDRTKMHSLLQGRAARELLLEAPYLVEVSQQCRLCQAFYATGIREDWGIALVSTASHRALIEQLRKGLWAQINRENHFFRYYDPRIARDWLLGLGQPQLSEFCGEILDELIIPTPTGIECVTTSGMRYSIEEVVSE